MRSRAVRRGVVGLVACIGTLVTGPVARAQTDSDITRLTGDLATVRKQLDNANARIIGIREQQVGLQRQISDITVRIDGFRVQIAETEGEIERLRAERDAIRAVVRTRAARLYIQRDPVSPLDAFIVTSPMKLARRQALASAIARRDEATRTALSTASDALGSTRDELAEQRSGLEAEEADLQLQQRALADLRAKAQAEQAALDEQAAVVHARLQAAIAAKVVREGGPSLLGPTNLTAAQMAAWWRAQQYPTPSLSVSVEALAQIYVEEGNAENVRGDVAFAQAVLETGGFRYTAPGNNFAGMGWCDSCQVGRVFPTPRDGVRAQIQHLKNYGDPTSRASGLSHPASLYWYAPTSRNQAIANENFDTFFAKGWALTWSQMGHGNWATDPNYSEKVLRIYAGMVAFAQGGGAV